MAMARTPETGFTYLALLFFIAVMGMTLSATSTAWSFMQQREKERELLYNGNAIRNAIAAYYERSPGTVKRYPVSFDDLFKDDRQLAMVRHLRRLYPDPMTLKPEWGVIRAADGGIKGVHSLSTRRAIKRADFGFENSAFEGAETYRDWRFVYEPSATNSNRKPGALNY
jgi:type II secretory pathway pseudopilin PulG